VVLSGLLDRARSPEELAGTLGHEMAHVQRRHGTKMIVRELSAATLLAAATGDATQFAQVVAAAQLLGRLHFSREAEREADEWGMRMVQAARVDPRGTVISMRGLAELDGGGPSYLRSHPVTAERVAALERLAAEATYEPVALLTEAEWLALKQICRGGAVGAEGASTPDGGAGPQSPR
jgi:predicted Zn-dependent protease